MAPKKIKVPNWLAWMKGEVERPTATPSSQQCILASGKDDPNSPKLLSQLLLPPKLTPLARILNGKTSLTKIHATGPQLNAKKQI